MKLDEAFARRLAAEIESELGHLDLLQEQSATAPRADDTFSLRARGSILHDFYNGIERVFVRIAEELNGGVPQGEQWHSQLMKDMSLEITGVRPALIDADLAKSLGEYRRFRHVFRNVYGFALEEQRIRPMEERLPAVLATFRSQVEEFLDWTVGSGSDL